MKPELVALLVNIFCLAWYIVEGAEPGKVVYWIGATLITVGLLWMKG